MNIYIYDIEVYAYDWIVVARRPEDGSPFTVIHNDNYQLREWINNNPDILGGFNNKHYDDYILLTMLLGGSNVEVKRHNDFIIQERRNPWEFPFIQYKKRPFKSFDLRDDIADDAVSLKSIEGNLQLQILESSIPFDIDRPLTPEELDKVIHYCKTDVNSTVVLYWARKENYLDAKIMAGEMYGIDPLDALSYTNAKLSAIALEATYTERDDERDYVIPEILPVDRIPAEVLDFFMQIRDKSIPDAKLFGAGKGKKGMTLDIMLKTSAGSCPVTYAWGGVHGAKPCVTIEETADRVIINQDVASLYPNSMINFGYTSRSMKDPDAYRKLVERRIGYKRTGDKKRSDSLKLIINTVYGAMLAKGNGLSDRLNGRSVCITNQLSMTVLIYDLAKACESIDFVNINTDGIMFTIDRSEVDLSEQIVADWSKLTGFEMERDDFKKVIQKDVNNYIGIKADGKFKTKGGYVSLYSGGNFKTNSLSIVHKAIVEYLVNGIDPEDTIRAEKNIISFQQIVKTGGLYEGAYHYINGERVQVQKVNRVYAVKDPKYGVLVKGKWIRERRRKNKETGKMDSIPLDQPVWQETEIPECPEHCCIDNENRLTVEDLDLDYYINIARKRIDKYINIDSKKERELAKITKEVNIMATKANVSNVYGKLNEARKRFLESGIKKEGVNSYAEFKYFRLEEIIPIKQAIFREVGLVDAISFDNEVATLTLYNVDEPNDFIVFMSQLAPDQSLIKNPIQKVGAIQTYVRRYLYMLALDIVEADAIEAVTGKPVDEDNKPVKAEAKKSKPATPAEREEVKAELTNQDGPMSKTQKTAITNGLKKLRARYMDDNKVVIDENLEAKYDPFVKATVKRVKAGLTKSEAEDLLIEIGNKITE